MKDYNSLIPYFGGVYGKKGGKKIVVIEDTFEIKKIKKGGEYMLLRQITPAHFDIFSLMRFLTSLNLEVGVVTYDYIYKFKKNISSILEKGNQMPEMNSIEDLERMMDIKHPLEVEDIHFTFKIKLGDEINIAKQIIKYFKSVKQ